MTRTWNCLFVFYSKELRFSLSLWVESMVSLVVRVDFPDFWTNGIKPRLFGFLFGQIILESFYCGAKKLEREWFFLDLERTFIDFVLSRSRVFALEVIYISFSGRLIQVGFEIQRLKISPDCGRFKITGWRASFFTHSQSVQIQLVLSRTHICCMIQRESPRLVLSPDRTCKVEFSLLVWIVVTRAQFLFIWNLLLIFHIRQSSNFLRNRRVLF